jgi:hypothetical protein
MATILRNNIGSVVSVTTANAIASGAYAVAADKLTIDNSTNKALLVDFDLNPTAFATAPVAGVLQLMAVDWSLDGTTAGPAPTASMLGRFVGSFDPSPATGNALTQWRMRLSAVALGNKVDFYLFNNATGQSLAAGAVLRAQCWSPG